MQQAKELYDQLSVLANQPQPNAEKTRQLLNTLKVCSHLIQTIIEFPHRNSRYSFLP